MANIMLQPFAELIGRSYGNSLGNAGFAADLLQAVNATVNEINQRADTETEIARVDGLATTLSLDVRHQNVLLVGVVYFMAMFGNRPRGSDVRNLPPLNQLRDEMNEAIRVYQGDVRNQLDPEDEDTDIVGLGYAGN